jgi:hypothetical protein
VGLAYTILKNKWSKNPFWQKHQIAAKYSLEQNGFSLTYHSTFTKLISNWNVNMDAAYDEVRWLNFYGLGNESKLTTLDRDFFRFRHKELIVQPSFERFIKNRQRIKIQPFYQSYSPIVDTGRFVSKSTLNNNSNNFNQINFTGLKVEYVYQHLNDSILPTSGIGLKVSSNYTQPLSNRSDKGFAVFGIDAAGYLPITNRLSLSVKAGAAALIGGTPPFYQFNKIGGNNSIRGYQRDRFHGSNTFYNQNELRWVTDINGYFYKGKIGAFILYDIGRIYEKNEISNTWHSGYGAGILLSPFNKITLFAAYAKSNEDKNLHLGFFRCF